MTPTTPRPVPRDVLHVRCRQCRCGYVAERVAHSRPVLRVRSSAGAFGALGRRARGLAP